MSTRIECELFFPYQREVRGNDGTVYEHHETNVLFMRSIPILETGSDRETGKREQERKAIRVGIGR